MTDDAAAAVPDIRGLPEPPLPPVLAPLQPISKAPPTGATLVELAVEGFDFVKGTDSRLYAIERGGARVAINLRGRDGLRQRIGRAYYQDHGRPASQASLTDALLVVEGMMHDAEEREISLRVGELDGATYLDLGRADGLTVMVTSDGWDIIDQAPVVFRRTAPMLQGHVPTRGGSLDDLHGLLNLAEGQFHLVIAWALAALQPSLQCPILSLTGQQGTAKTSTARLLAGLIDPVSTPPGAAPRHAEDWAVTAQNFYALPIDNLTSIPQWFSDTLCRTVTGDAFIRRERYTDDDVSIIRYRRPVIMTSIDPGTLQGDLADRLLAVELEPIAPENRRPEGWLDHQVAALGPGILGALLDLLAQVKGAPMEARPATLPRMAGFAQMLAALDHVTSWRTLPDYLATFSNVFQTVVEGNAFIETMTRWPALLAGAWSGTATMNGIRNYHASQLSESQRMPRDWPTDPRQVSALLKRYAPALVQAHVIVTEQPRTARGRIWRIERTTPAEASNLPPPGFDAIEYDSQPPIDKPKENRNEQHK